MPQSEGASGKPDRATHEQSPSVSAVPVGIPSAWRDVLAERERQMSAEGWSTDHDDRHRRGGLANAAACYAATERVFFPVRLAGRGYEPFTTYRDAWPWDDEWWKPKGRRRDLVRAGALILAEIERLDRAAQGMAAPSGGETGTGSTEGNSPVGNADAPTPNPEPRTQGEPPETSHD